jgi:hypothetical protein
MRASSVYCPSEVERIDYGTGRFLVEFVLYHGRTQSSTPSAWLDLGEPLYISSRRSPRSARAAKAWPTRPRPPFTPQVGAHQPDRQLPLAKGCGASGRQTLSLRISKAVTFLACNFDQWRDDPSETFASLIGTLPAVALFFARHYKVTLLRPYLCMQTHAQGRTFDPRFRSPLAY